MCVGRGNDSVTQTNETKTYVEHHICHLVSIKHQHAHNSQGMKISTGVGIYLFGVELALLVTWLALGIAIFALPVDAEYQATNNALLVVHLTTVFHFAVLLAVCLTLEDHNVFRKAMHTILATLTGRVSSTTSHRTSGNYSSLVPLRPMVAQRTDDDPEYLPSWGISIVITLGTDMCTIAMLRNESVPNTTIGYCEYVLAYACLCNTVCVGVWAMWMSIREIVAWNRRLLTSA